jgi:hypothetical protein
MNRTIVTKKSLKAQEKAEKPVEKNSANKEKLMELIHDLPNLDKYKETEKKDVLLEVQAEAGNDWLGDQVARLSEENEKLKKDLAMYKEQYELSLMDRPIAPEPAMFISPEEENTKREVWNLFRELENNYFGKNPQKQVYRLVKVEHILARMNSMFPFLKPTNM